MPLLAQFLGGLFTSLVNLLMPFLTKRLAIFIAFIALVVSVITTAITSIKALVAGISLVTPAFLNDAVSWFIPSNLDDAIAIIISAKIIAWVATWQVRIIQYKLGF